LKEIWKAPVERTYPIPVQYHGRSTPGDEWKWRVIFEHGDGYEEVLVKQLLVNVPSFSREDVIAGRRPQVSHGLPRRISH
jgi:hypothetical protein